ncbi:Mov34/MPN/PAD-1 family protein [Aeoliella sp.]|uniref:Mov34/MPN/PAD-1 family protein n=1 Tax=Aeoliella sp. TaxID=2795800 RepID=UPI003CCC18FE
MDWVPIEQVQYWTTDKKFGVKLNPKALRELLRHAQSAGTLETGGIAMGRYSECHTYATVDLFTGPPPDSQHGPMTFLRGTSGLQRLVAKLWRSERRYYLGEWHYHPHASAQPSGTDLSQMKTIANDEKYATPEPLLFIVGGDPNSEWELRVYLAFRNRDQLEPMNQRTSG